MQITRSRTTIYELRLNDEEYEMVFAGLLSARAEAIRDNNFHGESRYTELIELMAEKR